MINYENNRIIDFDSSICNYTEDQTTIHQFRELPQNTIELCFVNPEALLVNGNTLVMSIMVEKPNCLEIPWR